ncbi:MAG: phage terminase large subunit family protein [Glycocaulis sp.]
MLNAARFPDLASGASVVFTGIAACTPQEEVTVSQWADRHRGISGQSGSPHEGQWSTDRAPYLREIMDVMGVEHPAPRVVVRGSAQSGKSQALNNAVGHTIDTQPRSIMVMTPSLSKALAWNREQWEPMVEATPRLALKVMAQRSRSEKDSTSFHKRFRGGFLKLVTASSAKELQSSTIGLLVLEEPTDYPLDADGRGDPIDQARHRMDAWGEEAKELAASTPGEKGKCRITAMYEAGDQRRFFLPCPHGECGQYHELAFERMKEWEGRPVFACPSCGSAIEEHHLAGMLAQGCWVKTYTSDDPANPAPPSIIAAEDMGAWRGRGSEGRYPSFHFWQAYSPFASWRKIWAEAQEARANPEKLRTFYQQVLAEPYELAHDRPDWEAVRDVMTSPVIIRHAGRVVRGQMPEWAAVLIGSGDVQDDRLEWAYYGFGPGGRFARIDAGVIPIPAQDPRAWQELARVAGYQYEGPHMELTGADRFGVDTGGHFTHEAYRFARQAGVLALKGARDGDAPPITLGKRVKVKDTRGKVVARIPIHWVGTHNLKKRLYHGLAQAALSAETKELEPGSFLLDPQSTEIDYRQITAEYLVEDVIKGRRVAYWDKAKHQANEQTDLAVYALAMAIGFGVDRFDADGWQALFARRAKDQALSDALPLEKLMLAPDTMSEAASARQEELRKARKAALIEKMKGVNSS